MAKNASVEARQMIRTGEWRKPTAGLAPGYVQVNFVMLPAEEAADFHRFCQKNPKPCPLLAITEPGDYSPKALGTDIDLRTDVPSYRVFRDGVAVSEVDNITSVWRDDLVTFALGCSFTFEHSLLESGIGIRHIEQGVNVPMFRSNIQTVPAGRFSGPTVVTMRPMKAADAIRAIQITSRFPGVHGAPIHIGDPKQIGIFDLSRPEFGDPVEVRDGEIPVFWACGATPQLAIGNAKPPFCITHTPGYMLITDMRNVDYAVI